MKLFGSTSNITFSPIVTIEPRRRKFHCPIKLKIPLPAGYQSSLSANLHLLCSITGGQNRASWEDVTGSTPLSIQDNCLIFTTTVSARFWLVHCRQASQCAESTKFANQLYRQLVAVPFMAKFVVFAKRRDINEASVRVFCMTDDKEERTLEVQEHFSLIARSREVEVVEGQRLFLEFGGNLLPSHLLAGQRRQAPSSALIHEQLSFVFRAFHENRLAFGVSLRELGQEPAGRIAFMEDSIKYLASLNAQQRAQLNESRRRAVCTLGLALPPMCVNYDNILGTPKRNSYYASARIGDLTLADIAQELEGVAEDSSLESARKPEEDSLAGELRGRADWLELAPRLGIPRDEVDFIAGYCQANQPLSPALILLMHWYKLSSPEERDQDLARALLAIGRDELARKLNFPIEPKKMSRSTMELLREIELIPVRSSESLFQSELAAERRPSWQRRSDRSEEIRRQSRQLSQSASPSRRQSQSNSLADKENQRDYIDDRYGSSSRVLEQRSYIETTQTTTRSADTKQRRRKG